MSELAPLNIRLCGSVRSNRRGLPPGLKAEVDALEYGEHKIFQRGDMNLAIFHERCPMILLFNHVDPRISCTITRYNWKGQKVKLTVPRAFQDYFTHSRSVDVINQIHYSYLIGRKSRLCWPRLAWWLIDMCIINAFRLYQTRYGPIKHLDFRHHLFKQLIGQYRSQPTHHSNAARPIVHDYQAKDHYPIHSSEIKDCEYCRLHSDKRARSHIVCFTCKVHLCIGPCFGLYHQIEH